MKHPLRIAHSVGLVIVPLLFSGSLVLAQTDTAEPWWPSPLWGADDQAGGSNWITPAKVLEAVGLIETGQVYELGHVYEREMPLFANRTYAMFIAGSPTYPSTGRNRLVGHDGFLCTEIGNVGTQFDGLGHIGTRMTMADGSETDVFYNGVTIDEMKSPYGLLKLGIEHIKPIITRGVLVDVAGYKDVQTLPDSYEVTVEDVVGALRKQGMSADDIHPGDAILFRYGWARFWVDPERYNTNPPGIGLTVARWVAERKASMVGSDQWTTEVVPNPDPELAFPVHQELLVKNGIFNLENMTLDELAAEGLYEFAFVFTPVPFKGAAGSPGRPIAIR
jgi:kynurenine formamidase